MSFRRLKRSVILGIAVLAGSAGLAGLTAGTAGASTLTSADGFTTLVTQGTVTAQTPYSGGQVVTLQVAANSTLDTASLEAAGFPSGSVSIKFLECSDPGGLAANLPTKPSECEPGTIDSISGANANGSISLTGTSGYTILSPPRPQSGFGNGVTCGVAPNQCVVGIFSNQNDFSKPHLFSAPFVSTLGNGQDNGADPGDGTSPPASVPGPPTIGTATAGNASATVRWTAPTSNGGSAITGYQITPSVGSTLTVGNVTSALLTGLTNGQSYSFQVAAINGAGTGTKSASSNTVTPTATTIPGAPTIGAATAGDGSVTVGFTAPTSDGGAAISHYTVTATDSTNAARGGETATGAASPVTVSGLTNGDAYTFAVTATNSVGTGPSSGASATAVPVNQGELTVVQRSLPGVADGASYSQTLVVLGGTGKLKWAVTGGALPGKIKLGKTGILAGTVKSGKHPAAPGTYHFTVTVTQKGKKGAPTLTGSGSFSIVVTAT